MAAILTKPTSVSVKQTTATVAYNASGYKLPDDNTTSWFPSTAPSTGSTWTQTRKVTTYKNLAYSWNFGARNASGNHTFSGLTAGSANSISASVTITCTKTETTQTRSNSREWIEGTPAEGEPGEEGYKPAVPGEWGPWEGFGSITDSSSNTSTYTIANNVKTNTITVYTKPSNFSWSKIISKDQIIQLNLTHTDWNTLCTKVQQRENWKNQTFGANMSSANVSANDLVSASKYNLVAQKLGVRQVNSGDVIYASLFIALSTAVNN